MIEKCIQANAKKAPEGRKKERKEMQRKSK
jgi:hypothetical protein